MFVNFPCDLDTHSQTTIRPSISMKSENNKHDQNKSNRNTTRENAKTQEGIGYTFINYQFFDLIYFFTLLQIWFNFGFLFKIQNQY